MPLSSMGSVFGSWRSATRVDLSSNCFGNDASFWDADNCKDAATVLKAGSEDKRQRLCKKLFDENGTLKSGAQNFFNNAIVQRKLIKGIIEQTLDDKRITTALKNAIPNLGDRDSIMLEKSDAIATLFYSAPSMSFILRFFTGMAEWAQNEFADILLAGKFGKDDKVLEAIIENLDIIKDPAPELALKVARAIRRGAFGDKPSVLLKLVKKFDCLSVNKMYSPDVQKELASAISERRFGADSGVLIAVAERFDIFSHPDAQKIIAQAIKPRVFGKADAVLMAVAENLKHFTTTDALRAVVVALCDEVFGTNPAVLLEVVEHLKKFAFDFKFDNYYAHLIDKMAVEISEWPSNLVPGEQEKREKAFKSQLTQVVVKDVETQFKTLKSLADVIYRGQWGRDESVQKKVAEHLSIFEPLKGDAKSIVFAKFLGELPASPEAPNASKFSTARGMLVAYLKNLMAPIDKENREQAGKISAQLHAGIVDQQICTSLRIVDAFSNGHFIPHPGVQKEVAKNLRLFMLRLDLPLSPEQEMKRDEVQKKLLKFVLGPYFTDPDAKLVAQEFLAQYVDEYELSREIVGQGDELKAVVESFCSTTNLSSTAVGFLQSALQKGRFNILDSPDTNPGPTLKQKLEAHLQSLSDTRDIIQSAPDPIANKKVFAMQFACSPERLASLVGQNFLAEIIDEITFDHTNFDENNFLEVAVRKFCEPDVIILTSTANHLQRALSNKKFDAIDQDLKKNLQDKLNALWVRGTGLKLLGAGVAVVVGAYTYFR